MRYKQAGLQILEVKEGATQLREDYWKAFVVLLGILVVYIVGGSLMWRF
jgi:hypothetical protein